MTFKKYILLLTLLLTFSCSKDRKTDATVTFQVSDRGLEEVKTKALSVVTEPSLRTTGFRVSAVRGTEGDDEQVTWFTNTPFTYRPERSVFSGDHRWPSFDPHFRFYASNSELSYTAGGTTVEARNTQDVVCAYLNNPVYEALNVLEFEHVFALIGGVSVKWEPGYVLSDILITMTPNTGGTYNLYTGNGIVDGSAGWSNIITATEPFTLFLFPDPAIIPAEGNPYNPEVSTPVKINTTDLLLVPGEYAITARWTATLRSGSLQHQGTYTQTRSIQLNAGYRYAISATLGGDASMFDLEIERQPIIEWDASIHEYDGGEWIHYNELWK